MFNVDGFFCYLSIYVLIISEFTMCHILSIRVWDKLWTILWMYIYVVVWWTILGCTRIPKILSIRITAGYEDIYSDKYNIGQSQDLPGFLWRFIFRSYCWVFQDYPIMYIPELLRILGLSPLFPCKLSSSWDILGMDVTVLDRNIMSNI